MAVCAVALLALAPPEGWSLDDAGWPRLTWRGRVLTFAGAPAPADCQLADQRQPTGPPAIAERARTVWELPGGRLSQRLEPVAGLPHGVARTVVVERTGDRADLIGVNLRLAVTAPEGSGRWSAQSFMMVEAEPGGPTICAAFTSDTDPWSIDLATGANPRLGHHVAAAWRLGPGQTATIGTQYLWVVDGDLEAARATTAAFYAAAGLTVADGGPDWFRDAILYQACAGGGVESRFGDVGGFDAFARQLDYLADLGINAVWLQSVVTHKVPDNPADGWNLYDPRRFDEIDPSYGGEAGLRRLTSAFRERGIDVIGEIVPHGGQSPEASAHPEFWTYNRDGARQIVFGQGCDYSAPGWGEVIRRSIAWQTREFGFRGIRVDVADGSGANWNSPTGGPHASRSTIGGGIAMLQAIRAGQLEAGCTEPAIIPEVIDARPEYARWGPIGYGFRLTFFLEELQPASLTPGELGRRLTGFFERERGSLPPGMYELRCLNNHDSVVFWGRADRRFGVGLQQALTGVCCVIDGVPMIYQEQEVGSYETLRRLFLARRRTAELRRGDVRYVGVTAPEGVFAVLRTLGDSWVVGLVNLSWEPVRGRVALPLRLPDGLRLTDAVGGATTVVDDGGFEVELAAYQTAAYGPNARFAPPPAERHVAESRPVAAAPSFAAGGVQATVGAAARTETLPDGIRVTIAGGEELSIEIVGVDRWLVQSATGAYADRLLRRHYPWPPGGWRWPDKLAWGHEPSGLSFGRQLSDRQWQSAVAPLRDDGLIALAGPGGQGLAVRVVRTNAANIVLTDRSLDENPEPYGLTLRLLSPDRAVNPAWIPGWRKPGWRVEPTTAPADPPPLAAELEIVPLDDFAAVLAASRPEPARASSRRTGPGQAHSGQDRLWLVEPNWVEWTNLPVADPGDYTLWLQLRHTEQAADRTELTEHYRLSLDGRPLAFEWDRLAVWNTGNAWFGWARVPLGRLEPGRHSLRIETTHTWCALSPDLIISPAPDWRP